MASLYLCDAIGDGLIPETAFRPSGFDGKPNAVLMLHQPKMKALILSSDDAVTGAGISKLLTAASVAALRTAAASTNPSATKRTSINTWLTANGYQQLTVAQVSWFDCVQYVARQVNPDADLLLTS